MGRHLNDPFKPVPPSLPSFTFSTMPQLRALSFHVPPVSSPRRSKRSRPLSDVDGENSLSQHCKKRRLRLLLITSRLSLPFSLPPTHIVYRDSPKFAIWAKQKALGRNVLRKSAILNSIRRGRRLRSEDLGDFDDDDFPELRGELTDMERRSMIFGSNDPSTHPVSAPLDPGVALSPSPILQSPNFVVTRPPEVPAEPSPTNINNYDLLDREDELSYNRYPDEEDDEDWAQTMLAHSSEVNVIDFSGPEDAEDLGFTEVFPRCFSESRQRGLVLSNV